MSVCLSSLQDLLWYDLSVCLPVCLASSKFFSGMIGVNVVWCRQRPTTTYALTLSGWFCVDLDPPGLSRRLVGLLAEGDPSSPSPGERESAERIWVLFLSALEHFLLDLQKASSLIGRFPLTQRCDRRALVNTGQPARTSISGMNTDGVFISLNKGPPLI